MTVYSILFMRKLRHREVKYIAQEHSYLMVDPEFESS